MSSIRFEDAEKRIQSLLYQKLQYSCRSLDLVEFGFGNMISTKDSHGEARLLPCYCLHLLCPFRVVNANRIIAGRQDLYVTPSGDYDDVDLNLQHTCYFDSQMETFYKAYTSEYVKEITLNQFGDLHIILTSIEIHVFVAGSHQEESWRFYEPRKDKPHLVLEGDYFELD